MWLEIDDEVFHIENLSIQYTIESNATITFDVDLKKHSDYYTFFVDKYDSCRTFVIHTNQFMGRGCLIKILNIEFNNKIDITISCDSIERNISKQRDKKIDKILGQKE